MRKLAIALALSSTIIASPALARKGEWYVGGSLGPSIVEDTDFTITPISTSTSPPGVMSIDHAIGYDADVVFGYDFGFVRVEGEAAYKHNRVDSIVSSIQLPHAAVGPGSFDPVGGYVESLSGMINVLFEIGNDDGFSAFAGGGVGIGSVGYKNVKLFSNQLEILNDTDDAIVWQLIAGVRTAINDRLDVHLKYRFYNKPNLDMLLYDPAIAPALAGPLHNAVLDDGKYRSHSILGGLTYNIGHREPPPPPPPPPPAPVGPFIVFFDWDKDEITPQAAAILDNAAAAYASTGNAQVMLAGNADKSGAADYNVGLSQRRANNVRSYLAGKGIPDGVMSTEAFGESRPLVETADGVREPQNRNVQITFGPGSGR